MNKFLVLLLVLSFPIYADVVVTVPISEASQISTGSFNGEWTADVKVSITSDSVSNDGPGLYTALGYSIKCPEDIFEYGKEEGTTKSSLATYSMNISENKTIAAFSKWTEFENTCQFKWKAESIGTSHAFNWSITGNFHLVSISVSSTNSSPVPRDHKNGESLFVMRINTVNGGSGAAECN